MSSSTNLGLQPMEGAKEVMASFGQRAQDPSPTLGRRRISMEPPTQLTTWPGRAYPRTCLGKTGVTHGLPLDRYEVAGGFQHQRGRKDGGEVEARALLSAECVEAFSGPRLIQLMGQSPPQRRPPVPEAEWLREWQE